MPRESTPSSRPDRRPEAFGQLREPPPARPESLAPSVPGAPTMSSNGAVASVKLKSVVEDWGVVEVALKPVPL